MNLHARCVAWALLAAVATASHACESDSVALFSCDAANSRKFIELCAPSPLDAKSGFLVYRFGSLDEEGREKAVELEYPAERAHSLDRFHAATYVHKGVYTQSVRFVSGTYGYTVFTRARGSRSSMPESRCVSARAEERRSCPAANGRAFTSSSSRVSSPAIPKRPLASHVCGSALPPELRRVPWIVRDESRDDVPAIRGLVRDAFATAAHAAGTEHLIVDGLRHAGALAIAVVAQSNEAVIGYAAASPVTIADGAADWYGLGPLAVSAQSRRRGLGAALVEAVLTRLSARAAAGCVVVGDPGHYQRFGFVPDPNLTFPGVPPEYFMRLLLRGPAAAGRVAYHAAFDIAS